MNDRIDSTDAASASDGRLRALWHLVGRGHLVYHAVAAAVYIILLMQLVPAGSTWSSDEGAVRAQVEVIAVEGTWSRDRPFSEIDREGLTSPIHVATVNGDQYFPYTKQPAYPLLLVPLRSLFGQGAVVLPSILGAVLAAVAGAQIAGLLSDRIRILTFWILVAGSPLFFYAYIVKAHTVAAAASTLAVLVVLRASNRGLLASVAAGGLIFVAVLLRAEAVLFGAALAIAVLLVRPLAARFRNEAFALVVGAAAMLAHFGSRWWAVQVAGVEPMSDGVEIFNAARVLSGMLNILLLLNTRSTAILIAVVMTGAGCSLLALTVLREPWNLGLQWILAGVSITGSLTIVLIAPEAITGLVAAMPLLIAGLVVLERSAMANPHTRLILLTSLLFFVGVFATQAPSGGGLQWGGRYLMLAVPMLTAVAVASLRKLLKFGPAGGYILVSVLAIATVALSFNAAVVLVEGRQKSQEFNRRIAMLALDVTYDPGRRPVIVSTQTHIGRSAWRTLDDVDYFLVPDQFFAVYVRRLAGEGLLRIGMFVDWNDDREALLASLGYRKLEQSEAPFVIVVRVGD